MVDYRIMHIYISILKENKSFKQYWYQKIQSKFTSNVELIAEQQQTCIVLKPFSTPISIGSIITLTPDHQESGSLVFNISRSAPSRIKLFKLSLKWCIIYMKEVCKSFVQKML